MRRLLSLAVIACLLGTAVVIERFNRALPREDPLGRQLLFLPTPEALKLMSLGNPGLAADLLYLWAIQYYSVYSQEESFLYLDTMFEMITDLDPLYYDAYATGGLIMAMAAQRDPQRIAELRRLYDKGVAAMPDEYALAELAAWDFHTLFHDQETALHFMAIAASRPQAPNRLLRVLGAWRDQNQAWTTDESIRYWQRATAEATSARDRSYCLSHLYDVVAQRDRELLDPILATFEALHGACPTSWRGLVRRGLLSSTPVDANGAAYGIDPTSCRVVAYKKIRGN